MSVFRTPDRRAVFVLVVLPLLLFGVPALFGYPAVAGDNAIQNFPLRALSGHLIAEGHLPLWNSYIWSGTPLLGGLNAGSAYPFTWLFAVFPPIGAWILNLLLAYWAAGLGMYALVRQFRVAPLAAFLAGATYSLGGAMTGQLVHIGIVQGMAWMPLLVLALVRLSWSVLGTGPVGAEAKSGSPWAWVLMIAATLALLTLTGEPRSMAEGEIVASFFTVWLAARPYGGVASLGRRIRFVAYAALGALWSVLLAAAQILPGWAFISASQRATEDYWYFGAGSLRPSWSVLMLVPDLFGGNGILGQPSFFNSYNGVEVAGYVGLLPLVALAALATRTFGRRRTPRSSDWGPWLALVGLGVLLSWGSYTPLGHVFQHIPLFGKTRLQSRNLGIVDLGLAVLLGFWADRALSGDAEGAGLLRWRRWVLLAPLVGTGVVLVAALALPGPLEQHFGASASSATTLGRDLTPWLLGYVVVVLGFAAVFFGWKRITASRRQVYLAAGVLFNLVLFITTTVNGIVPTTVLEPNRSTAVAQLGSVGRFAVYDSTVSHLRVLTALGQPDVNESTRLFSVQGYASILSNFYGAATGTHTMDNLDPCALAKGTFTQLRLTTLATVPGFLAPGVEKNGSVPPPPPTCSGQASLSSSGARTFYIGWALPLISAHLLPPSAPAVSDAAPVRVGVLGPKGGVHWPPSTISPDGHGGWNVHFSNPEPAFGLRVTGPASASPDTSTVTGTTGASWGLDGVLQDAMSSPGWGLFGTWQGITFFRHTSVRSPVWVDGNVPGAEVHQVRVDDWGTEVDHVTSPRSVTVVRSEAYQPGWHVLAAGGGGPVRTFPVEANGIVQAVQVPAGTWTLTFLYRPRTLNLGLIGSGVGTVLLVVSASAMLLRRRYRQRAGPIGCTT